MKTTGNKLVDLRKDNRELILKAINLQPLSCSQLSRKLNLSGTGVITIVDELIREGVLQKTKALSSSVGRKSLLLSIKRECGVIAVINLTGAMSVSLFTLNGKEIAKRDLPHKSHYSTEDWSISLCYLRKCSN